MYLISIASFNEITSISNITPLITSSNLQSTIIFFIQIEKVITLNYCIKEFS